MPFLVPGALYLPVRTVWGMRAFSLVPLLVSAGLLLGCAPLDEAAQPPAAPAPAAPAPAPAAPAAPAPAGDVVEGVEVVSVVDGDTVKLRLDGKVETVRLVGLNTPETVDPRRPVECFGLEASARAKELLSGRTVTFEFDDSQDRRDRYGRLLGFVRLDGRIFNEVMIREGYAYEYTYDAAYRYQDLFRAAQAEAEAAGRGLWSSSTCGGVAAPAEGSSAAPAEGSSGAPADRDCGDFGSYGEAKGFFDEHFAAFGDFARLDPDGDSVPCESLPGAP